MCQDSLAARLKDPWRWRNARQLLVVASAITVIISLFEIRLDPLAMLREVASNFIVCAAITFMTSTVIAAVGKPRLDRNWQRSLVLVGLMAVGGMLGGLIGWGVNDLVFNVRMSHPWLYLMIVALLAIIFGVAIVSYETVSLRLRETASRLAEKEVQEQQLLRLRSEAELEALRAKVNPHFLFNTLNSIASLIPEDPAKAEDTVQRLSNLFRHVLSAAEAEFVPLQEELAIIREYLEIEKVRLGDRLEYTLNMDSALNGTVIPTMLLQPIVENSVKHGIAPKKRGGRVEVTCERVDDRCAITIADTGTGLASTPPKEGFGVSGVRRRLHMHYPGEHAFDMTSKDGVTVSIEIPVYHDS